MNMGVQERSSAVQSAWVWVVPPSRTGRVWTLGPAQCLWSRLPAVAHCTASGAPLQRTHLQTDVRTLAVFERVTSEDEDNSAGRNRAAVVPGVNEQSIPTCWKGGFRVRETFGFLVLSRTLLPSDGVRTCWFWRRWCLSAVTLHCFDLWGHDCPHAC